ncbi:MAG: hypothetical protein JXB15_12480 [Anaerolineales bacterium]|nr:hypothetical protein [Anaerolineales bacterium]
MAKPRLTFACELDAEALQKIMTQQVLDDLLALEAHLSLGILDLSTERADTVRQLNRAGVPVIAWLLLPKEQGYWFNLYNAPQAAARYDDFMTWTAEHGLKWAGIGLDIEPDINEITELSQQKWKVVPKIIRRIWNRRHLKTARTIYQTLVAQIHADGYPVDAYQFPFISDERKAGSTLLQRAVGLVDLSVDREVWMLYSSFIRPNGAGFIASYAPEAQCVGLGSTGGGVELGLSVPPLTWEEFARDLRLAWYYCNDLFIFSLEGCIQQGFLKRLPFFVWDSPLLLPEDSRSRVDGYRSALQSGLWMVTHFSALLIGAASTFLVWKGISYWIRKRASR